MAGQLIYTSAPRLLEAGRSGFGTVARHREIPALVVAAIERLSQFTRLPGVDVARVIYSHRVVAAAGARYHVLSCIRDAGADYTGRTNHLAHHLVIDPREMAALGDCGPSPADVLLAMAWVSSWNEAPRYFEKSEEVFAGNFAAQGRGDGAAWARVTGEPRHAWLLATGEASRGAYLVVPPGTDLRPLFAESLRLTPERLWQVTFTTALQASDEPSDFRWIGLDADAPQRAQAENSGRIVLDLSRPVSLPLPELPAAAPAPTVANPVRAVPPPASIAAAAVKPGVVVARSGMKRRKAPSRWLVGSVCACLVVGLTATGLLWRARQQKEAVLERVTESLRQSEFFGDAPVQELRRDLAGAPASVLAAAQRIGELADRSVQALRVADFDKLQEQCAPAPRQIAKDVGLNLPAEIGALFDAAAEVLAQHARLTTPPGAPPRVALVAELRELRKSIGTLGAQTAKPQEFGKVRRELTALAERKEAGALLAILRGSEQPRENRAWFEEALRPAEAMIDPEAQRLAKTASQIVAAWLAVENGTTKLPGAELPGWLSALVEGKVSSAKAPAPNEPEAVKRSATGLYFALRSADLKDVPIKELTGALNFSLARRNEEAAKFAFHQNGVLRRNFNSQDDGFVIRNDRLVPEPNAPEGPYRIAARAEGALEDAFVVHVGEPRNGDALFGTAVALSLKGDALEIRPTSASLAGQLAQPLWLDVPAGFDGHGTGNQVRALQNGALNLRAAREALQGQAKVQERLLRSAEEELRTLDTAKGPTIDTDAAIKALRTRGTYGKETDKHFAQAQKAAPATACDELLKAISIQWNTWLHTDFAKADEIWEAGQPLRVEAADPPSEKALRATVRNLELIMQKAKTREQKPLTVPLEIVRGQLLQLASSGESGDAERVKRRTALLARLEGIRRSIEALQRHPLQRSQIPPGGYRLLVEVPGGAKLPLAEVAIP